MKKVQGGAYVLFLLSNGAFGEELALAVKEIESDLSPISRSLCRIAKEIYNIEIPFTANLGTYHFLRKQTQGSELFKALEPLVKTYYKRKENKRIAYLNLAHDDKRMILEILERVARYSGIDSTDLRIKYRDYLVRHLIQNELAAHEQLIFFGRVNYRDYLMDQFNIG
ncbi:UNVERIFIED_CONTAM: hypothetical protein ABIC26_002637 [Paenibacillus sp. PvR008]